MIKLTANIDPRFETAFPESCARIGCKPIDLLRVMFSESGASPEAHNRAPGEVTDKATGKRRASLPEERYNAVGLIQFMPAILRGLGWVNGYEAFKHLSASEQLPYVVAYFNPWQKTGAPWTSAGRIYQACFLPATLAGLKKDDDVLTARGGFLGWAYEANVTFDANGDGKITIGELTEAVQRNCHGPRWLEILDRLGLADDAPTTDLLVDAMASDATLEAFIRSPRGLQLVLDRLGYDVGPRGVDGVVGADTRAAVAKFQEEHEMHVDGAAGKDTRLELAIALHTAA